MTTAPASNGKPQLTDRFGRRIEYVRLSVADKCNLRCFYCIPEGYNAFERPEHWLDVNEIERVMAAFAALGVERVRITGGEPLVRRELPEITRRLAAIDGITDLSLSTNASLLDKMAEPLATAGIARINVSLDSLRADRFHSITGGDIEPVLQGLKAASTAGFSPVKINMVVMKGINDDEIIDMVEFCIEHGFTLRFIETMPVGATGTRACDHYLDLGEVRSTLESHYELLPGFMPGGGPARYCQVSGTELRIGFITPISRHFCESCNRVRLSVDGTLYLCLGQEHKLELRPALRAGATPAELQQLIRRGIELKPERHTFREQPGQIVRLMNMTGG
jgi:cyclic pyranopterin phosphate synthase